MEPHYANVPLRVNNEWTYVTCCGWCGALVPPNVQHIHNAWHKQLQETREQASYADMVSRPIG